MRIRAGDVRAFQVELRSKVLKVVQHAMSPLHRIINALGAPVFGHCDSSTSLVSCLGRMGASKVFSESGSVDLLIHSAQEHPSATTHGTMASSSQLTDGPVDVQCRPPTFARRPFRSCQPRNPTGRSSAETAISSHCNHNMKFDGDWRTP